MTQSNNTHLILTILDDLGNETNDKLLLNGAFNAGNKVIELLEFENGDTMTSAEMQAVATPASSQLQNIPVFDDSVMSDNEVYADSLWFEQSEADVDSEAGIPSASIPLNSQVDQLVSAMASFDAPSDMATVKVDDTKEGLQATLVSSWQ